MVSTFGASSALKSPASIWRGVVFVVLVVGLMAMGRGAWAFSCADVTEIPKTECEALVDFYNSTDGANWGKNIGWNKTNTPCSWGIVKCSDGHVTIISKNIILPSKISGSFPESFINLSYLEHIDLQNNQLSGSIKLLENLSRLKSISLGNNQLSGSIPESFGNLKYLQNLLLYGNQLSGSIPESLGNLGTKMSYLYLQNNQLSGFIPESLGNLRYLQVLQLQNNKLCGDIPQSLWNLIHASKDRLFLQNNHLTANPDMIAWLNANSTWGEQTPCPTPKTTKTDCAVQTQIPKVECEALVDLYNSTDGANWGNNTGWLKTNTPCSWYGVRGCSDGHVTDLNLGDNQLSGSIPESLSNLSSLYFLNLNNNELCGDIPLSLMSLGFLQKGWFNLQNNHLTASDPELIAWLNANSTWGDQTPCPTPTDCAVQTQIPKVECEALVALYESTDGDNWKDNTGWNETNTPCSWYGVSCGDGHVTSINLGDYHNGGNDLNGSIPDSLGNLRNLQYLSMRENHLSGSLPESFGNLSNLKSIELNRNQLSGSIPESFGNLSNLKSILLSHNQLSGSIPESLGNLSNSFWRLRLNNNQLSGSIPESLGNLISMWDLSLRNNQLSGSIPESFGNFGNLYYLALNDNQLSGSIPESLGNLSKLLTLDMSNNQLNGSIPESLGNLSKLHQFSLNNNELCGDIPLSLMNLLSNFVLSGSHFFYLNNNHLTISSDDPDLIAWFNDNWRFGGQTPCPTPNPDGFMVVQGNLTENGQPMPVGTTITFVVNDSVIGETTTLTAGKFNQNSLS
ncbi:MAG: hypothetical protein DRQ57_17470, partial [Gammaproteobacteria bacterium]